MHFQSFEVVLSVILTSHISFGFLLSGPTQRGQVNAKTATSDSCRALARAGDCGFWDCFEQRFPCGSNGYAQAYGGKYCKRLKASTDKFTPEGNEFIRKEAICQMDNLLQKYYDQPSINCRNYYDDAFVKMGACYAQSGYCDVVVDNFDGFMKTFDRRDFLNLKLEKQVIGAARQCGGDVINGLVNDYVNSDLSG